jgi:hypothetical protein
MLLLLLPLALAVVVIFIYFVKATLVTKHQVIKQFYILEIF